MFEPMNTVVEKVSLNDVVEFFHCSPYPHLASLVKSVDENEVVLDGVCGSFHSKQLAQNVASRCPGISRVRNQIRVVYFVT
jgi:hypothetical protein